VNSQLQCLHQSSRKALGAAIFEQCSISVIFVIIKTRRFPLENKVSAPLRFAEALPGYSLKSLLSLFLSVEKKGALCFSFKNLDLWCGGLIS
jgi:hypothetical protein